MKNRVAMVEALTTTAGMGAMVIDEGHRAMRASLADTLQQRMTAGTVARPAVGHDSEEDDEGLQVHMRTGREASRREKEDDDDRTRNAAQARQVGATVIGGTSSSGGHPGGQASMARAYASPRRGAGRPRIGDG